MAHAGQRQESSYYSNSRQEKGGKFNQKPQIGRRGCTTGKWRRSPYVIASQPTAGAAISDHGIIDCFVGLRRPRNDSYLVLIRHEFVAHPVADHRSTSRRGRRSRPRCPVHHHARSSRAPVGRSRTVCFDAGIACRRVFLASLVRTTTTTTVTARPIQKMARSVPPAGPCPRP